MRGTPVALRQRMHCRRTAPLVACLLFLGLGRTAHAASLTLAWDPSPESSVVGYVLWYGTQSGTYVSSIDAGAETSRIVTGLADDTVYYFVVQAYTTDGLVSAPSQEVSGITPAVVLPPPPSAVSSVSVTPNMSAPQLVGTSVGWSAAASGGVAPYSYRWWLSADGGTTALTSWTSSNSYSWTPTAANSSYQVTACARSSGSTSTTGEACLAVPFPIVQPASVSLASDLSAPQAVGTAIVFTATASGGVSYQYKWWLSTNSGSEPLTGWTNSNQYTWIPSSVNRHYVITVWVRSAGNSVDAPEMTRSVSFPIVGGGRCKGGKC